MQALTINQVIRELESHDPNDRVVFSFADCVPTKVESWRGVYAEPAIGWQPSGYSFAGREQDRVRPTVGSLLEELRDSISGKMYCGWKGGEYYYDGSEILHVENEGDYTSTHTVITDIYGIECGVVLITGMGNYE